MLPLGANYSATTATLAVTFVPVGIFNRVLMPMWTVSNQTTMQASQGILSTSDSFKVVGIHTGAIATQVIPFKADWCAASKKMVGENGPLVDSKNAIADSDSPCQPLPAAVGTARVDFGPETSLRSATDIIEGHRVTSGVMRTAVCAARPLHFSTGMV